MTRWKWWWLRRYVMRNRGCPVPPSTLHLWLSVDYPDPTSFGGAITVRECVKCKETR
jgi:hypothetical protein